MRELVYYVAVSLDGFIAGPEGQFDGFPVDGDHMQAIAETYPDTIPTDLADSVGIERTTPMFDTVLMGWNTYAVGLPLGVRSPYRHLRQIVFSRTRRAEADDVETRDDDPVAVVRALKREQGRSLWLCGGGAMAATLSGEIDRLVLKRNPVLFGSGVPLFAPGPYAPERFDEVATTAFRSGVVISEYTRAAPH